MPISRYDFGGLVFAVTRDFARLERNFCKVAGLYQGQPRILTILKTNEGVTLSELSPLCGIGLPTASFPTSTTSMSCATAGKRTDGRILWKHCCIMP